MIKKFGQDDPKIHDYVLKFMRPEDPILEEIRLRCEWEGLPTIQVGSMDALHLEILTRVSGAKKAVEIGTLGGYSGVCIARGLGLDGKLYTFEYEPKHAKVARESFRRAGLTERIEIFVGAALENLPKIEEDGPFDLVFLDADKDNYVTYLEWAARHLRMGGTLMADNTFAWGMIAQTEDFQNREEEIAVRGLQQFNQILSKHRAFRATQLPTAEGLALAVKVRDV